MRIPLWAIILGAAIIVWILVSEAKKRDFFSEDNRNKVTSVLTDNPFTQFVTSNRG